MSDIVVNVNKGLKGVPSVVKIQVFIFLFKNSSHLIDVVPVYNLYLFSPNVSLKFIDAYTLFRRIVLFELLPELSSFTSQLVFLSSDTVQANTFEGLHK